MERNPTVQHLTWFLDLRRFGQLNISPSYQRRSVWNPKDRKLFLDTIFKNYPAPTIFLHRDTDEMVEQYIMSLMENSVWRLYSCLWIMK